MVDSDRQHEDRLAFLRSLTQEDRDFISRFGEQRWRQFKEMQEFKQINVEESKRKQPVQQRKERLLAKIEADILKMESEMKEENEKLGLDDGTLEMWETSGLLDIMATVWNAMFENMHSTSDKPPNRVTFTLSWKPTEKNEYKLSMDIVAEPIRKELEKWLAEKEKS